MLQLEEELAKVRAAFSQTRTALAAWHKEAVALQETLGAEKKAKEKAQSEKRGLSRTLVSSWSACLSFVVLELTHLCVW